MSVYSELIVYKENGTYSDTLEVFGLIRLMRDFLVLAGEDSPYIRLRDSGGCYIVSIRPGIEVDSLDVLRQSPLAPIKAIPTSQYNTENMPPGTPFIDADAITRYFEALKNDTEDIPPRPPHLDVIQTINPASIQGYNGTIISNWWRVKERQPEIFLLILKMYSSDLSERQSFDAIKMWKQLNKAEGWKIAPNIPGQLIFNPDQGMGQNRPKADAKLNSGSKIKINFWLIEYLRAVGFYEIAIPRYVGYRDQSNTDKDRKILIPQPLDLTYADNQIVLQEFKDNLFSEPHIQFDLLATFRYLIILLKYFNRPENRHRLRSFGNVKHKIVKGFAVAFYKTLGRARPLMNYSYIDFPAWIEVNNESDARIYIEILDELIDFTRQFEEKNSDAFTLLQHLRDFVSGDDLEAFFRLTTAFSSYLIQMIDSRKYSKQLSTHTIERIIRMTDAKLSPILESPGFKNIAAAIRASTVTQQRRKASGKDRLYDIRYGLGRDLNRVADKSKPARFIAALSEFMSQYNAENARVYETQKKQFRKNITTNDIEDITRLIDEYDASTIARMLVAYGYARVPKDDDAAEDSPEEQHDDND